MLYTYFGGLKLQSLLSGYRGSFLIFILVFTSLIGHFTVMDGSEAKGDLVLIQTFFALLWKLFLKNTS